VILVDTSIWIDHLRAAEPRLAEQLGADEIGSHSSVVEELALGSIKKRGDLLGMLGNLRPFPVLTHEEVLALVEGHRLWGRGLSAIDVHLLGSVALVPGARLWTRDKRLLTACRGAGVAVVKES
jgi:predicted nucleic acid-binding protein